MKNIDNINEKVENRKKQLQPLFDKDKENYDLWVGKEQIFDTHKMAINVTGTEMVALRKRCQDSIVRSRLDIHVLPPKPIENPSAKKDANQEERMYYHGFDKADERLSMLGEAKLKPAMAWQAITLGRVAVRVLVYYCPKRKRVIWDILPMIPRFVTFSFDSEGLDWYSYETFRSPAAIKSEYGVDVPEDTQGKGISVSDYWDREHNVRYLTKDKEALSFQVGGKKVTAWEHPFKEVPAIIQPVAGGPKAITSEGTDVTAWGQSVFDPIKTPFRTLNLLRSIVAHHAHLLAKTPIEAIRNEGSEERIEEQELSFYPNSIINHTDALTLKSLDLKDIPPSILTMMGDISTSIQRVTGADLHPEWAGSSGAALRIAGQDRQDVNTPIVDTLNTAYTRICRMVKGEVVTQKLEIPVQIVVNGEYSVFDIAPKQLDNDFYVNAELVRRDVYDEESQLQRAQMLMQLRLKSREDIMEQEMNEQDVPTQIMKMDMEEIEAAIPEMKLRRLIKDLQREFDDLMEQDIEDKDLGDKIKMMKEQLGMLVTQKQQALMGGGQPQGGVPPGAPR